MTNGSITLQTVTLTVGDLGTYKITGLPVPSTYTVTFSRGDLASVTQAVDLDPFGQRDVSNVNASMPDATGAITGRITEIGNGDGVGEVDITLSDGSTTFHTRSETKPSLAESGNFLISNVKPGTYTLTFARVGASPVSLIVAITAGQIVEIPASQTQVSRPASISGTVVVASGPGAGQPLQDAEVRLFVLSQYPNTVLTRVSTDADGHFVFTDLVAPESYLLEFAYPSGAPAQTTRTLFNINPGEDNPLTLPVEVSTG